MAPTNQSMAQRKMYDPMDDIARQAHQGSVAAIIQTLNEQLADAGVRTRAVFEDGVLQLLCEAASKEQLEQSVLVPQVRRILEDLAPRNIRRVKINSRIVREQQLLWLEEIMRDPENQLLWSEQIVLAKPNLFKQLLESRKNHQTTSRKKPTWPKGSSRYLREKNRYWRGIYSGVGLSLLLLFVGLFVGWLLNELLAPKPRPNPIPKSSLTAAASPDPFAQAVRIAD